MFTLPLSTTMGRRDRTFILSIIEVGEGALEHVDEALLGDMEFVTMVVVRNPLALAWVGERARQELDLPAVMAPAGAKRHRSV